MDPSTNIKGSDMPAGEEHLFYARPRDVGLADRTGFYTTSKDYSNAAVRIDYKPPISVPLEVRRDVQVSAEKKEEPKVSVSKMIDGTFSQGTFVQLASRGPQDVYLTYNPVMTFFKQVYKRHTNFAVEQNDERFSTTVRFGTTNTCQLSKRGDLIGNVYLRLVLPNLGIVGGTWVNTIGYSVFNTVKLRIGDAVVHDQERLWYDIEDKLFCASEKYEGLNKLVKRDQILDTNSSHELLIPLKFFCCRRNSSKQQFIPIMNLNTNINVLVDISIPNLNTLVNLPAGKELPQVSSIDASMSVDYVFLDQTEKFRFAQSMSTYMIEQIYDVENVSYKTSESGIVNSTNVYVDMKELNKPVKYFAIVAYQENDNGYNYLDVISDGSFYIGSDKQFNTRDGNYFSLIQTYQHFKRCDNSNVSAFSFCIDAGSFQPTGTLNFADIIRSQFAFTIPVQTIPIKIKIFAVCLNWLEFSSGLCSTRFN